MPGLNPGDILPPNKNILSKIARKVKEQLAQEALVLELQDKLKDAERALREISDVQLPELLEEANMSELTTEDGTKVTLKSKVVARIPKGNPKPALDWLEKSGYGKIIKRVFVIEFDKADEEWARKFEEELSDRDHPLNVVRKHDVAWQTLEKTVGTLMQDGVNVPLELFGGYHQKTTKLKKKDIE